MPRSIVARELKGLERSVAEVLAETANAVFVEFFGNPEDVAPDAWDRVRKEIIQPAHPIEAKRALYDAAFDGWNDTTLGPRPTWRPDAETLAVTNITAVMQTHGFTTFDELYNWSIEHGQDFWAEMVGRVGIVFKNPPEKIVDNSDPKAPRWFLGAKLNITDSLFQAAPDDVALIYQKEGDAIERITYGELDARSNQVANALQSQGFQVGDHFAIDMPMNVEAVAMYIGVMKAGCTVVCLADSLDAMCIDSRIKQIPDGVKAIFTQDVTGGKKAFPLYDKVVEAKETPRAIVVSSKDVPAELKRDGDISWESFIAGASGKFESVAVGPEHNINIIFSSSTSTGKETEGEEPKPPKAIPWKANSAIKGAVDAHLHHNMQPGKVLNWQTNLGWMMGAFDVFGTMVNKGTLAMYDGNPVSKEYGKFVEEAKVNVLGTVPVVSERWEDTGCIQGCDWSNIELFSSTGAPSNPRNYFYLMSLVPNFAPVIEYCGGTEIGGGYITGSLHHPASPSMFTTPTLGTQLAFPADTMGRDDFAKNEVAIVMRSGKGEAPPMGLSTELLNFDHGEKYFGRGAKTPNGYLLREHGDVIAQHPAGFMQSGGRSDDGLNINGIKTSSTELEGFIKEANIKGLEDVVVVAARPPAGGGDLVVAFAVMAPGSHIDSGMLQTQFKKAIKMRNPQLARVDAIEILDGIPRTASNKIRRNWMRDSWVEEQGKLKDLGQTTVLYAKGGLPDRRL